jgi:hypothetical protein
MKQLFAFEEFEVRKVNKVGCLGVHDLTLHMAVMPTSLASTPSLVLARLELTILRSSKAIFHSMLCASASAFLLLNDDQFKHFTKSLVNLVQPTSKGTR